MWREVPYWEQDRGGAGIWNGLANLPIPRITLGAATGSDGRVYAIGGHNAFVYLATVDAYTPSNNTWSAASNMPTPRYFLATAAGQDGRIYAIGGLADSYLASVEAYTPSTDTWTTVASMPTARWGVAAVAGPDGRIYAIGGYNGLYLSTVEAYTPSTNTWTTVAPLPAARWNPAAAVDPDGRIFIMGGADASDGFANSVYDYNPSTNTWATVSSMPTARWGLAAAAGPDGRIYAVGGYNGSILNTVEAYTPSTNTWATAATLPTAREYLAAAAGPDGRNYAIGGETSSAVSSATEALNFNSVQNVSFLTNSLSAGIHSVTAIYSGDSNFADSASGNFLQTVNKANTTTVVTNAANPAVFGQSVTFTATVSITSPGAGTPTGTVTFQDSGTSIGTGALTGGTTATFRSNLTVATHIITASYGGDTNFSGSTSGTFLQTVNQATTTTVTNTVNPSTYGNVVTFTATVSPQVANTFDSGGTVTFSDGSTSIGTGSVSGTTATFSTTTLLSAGTHTIKASYGGDTNFATSSGSVLQTVSRATTTTTVTTSVVPANPSGINVANVGQTVTIKAAVAGTPTTPTGTVTFLDGTISLGTGSVNGSGQATFTTSSLEATRFMGDHPHALNAVYSGDSNFSTGPSNIVNQEIASTAQMSIPTTYISIQNKVVSVQVNFFNTTTAGAIQNSSNSLDEFDIAITYDTTRLSTPADGSGVSPGNVTGHAGNAPNGNPWAFVINAGVDPNYDPSNNLGRITIDGYTPCGGLEGFTGGSLVNIAFTVLSNAPVGGAIINLRQSVTSVYPCTLPTAAHSTSSSDAAQGNYFLMGGPSNTGPSDGADVGLDGLITIHNGVNSTTTLTSSTNPSVFGQSVTFTATVNGADSGTPTGTVTFNDNGTSIGTGSVTGGLATFTTTTLTVATHTITAVYGGDNDYFASSGSLTQTVNDGLIVSSFMATATGFTAVFNHTLNLGNAFTPILNLYDNSTGTLGPADVTLVGTASGAIRGSLVVDAVAGRSGSNGNTRITFIQTGQTGVLGSAAQSTLFGVLPNDTYTVTLRSASNGFQDTNGNLLDGNGDGTPGDDYVTTFVVNNPANAVTVTLPDFAHAPDSSSTYRTLRPPTIRLPTVCRFGCTTTTARAAKLSHP